MARSRLPRSASWLPALWSAVLAVLLLGPALQPGYVLSFDMVWVPDLALRRDVLGVGSALPRAVPSDAVVAVLDEVVPGMLLQKLVLAGVLVGGGAGAARLGPPGDAPGALAGRLAAASVYVWSPFVAERIVLGHWPVLLCYAVLPWVALAGRRCRETGRLPVSLLLLVPLGSLSANAGLMTACLLLAVAFRPGHRTGVLLLLAVLGAANAPWLVAGLLHASHAVSTAAGAVAFGLSGTGSLPAPLAALGLGGVWNAEVVPDSRSGPAAWFALLLVVVLVVTGLRPLVRRWPRRDLVALAACWLLGYLLATATWAAPEGIGWLAAHVPGAGLLRDGARQLALCAPLLAAAAGHGAAAVVARGPVAVARAALGVGVVLSPLAVLPDAAWGGGGRLVPVRFPEGYAAAREQVRELRTRGPVGDVVLLPFTSYRAPVWNGGRKVLDPLGRYLPLDYVGNDELAVDGTLLPGEDPRAGAVAGALRLPAEARQEALATLGVGLLADQRPSGAVTLTVVPGAAEQPTPAAWTGAMALAWGLFLALPAGWLLAVGRRRWRRGAHASLPAGKNV